MVTIERSKCVGCGLCTKICHHQCIHLVEESNRNFPEIEHEYCSTCSQCVAVCPQQALAWDDIPPHAFNTRLLPTDLQIEEFLKERRTIRKFSNQKVSKNVLKEIGAIGGYAPTNHFNLRCIILDDQKMIQQLDEIMLRQLIKLDKYIFHSEFSYRFFRLFSPHVNSNLRRKIQMCSEKSTVFESRPAALFFVVGEQDVLLSSESAQFAAYNMMLYAQVKQLGTRYLAAGPTTLNVNRKARSLMKLKKHENILSAFELGVPAVRFHNKVRGKDMPVNLFRRKL